MRRYETIVIVDPDLGEEQRGTVFDKIRELIPQRGGLLVQIDEWGGRKLAYEIKKKQRGYYARIDFCGSGGLVSEMERQFRIDDRVMKYMTILLDEDANMERIQEEMMQSKAEVETKTTPSPDETAAQVEADDADTPATASETEPAAEAPESETQKEDV